MKLYLFHIRPHILIFCITIVCHIQINAQDSPVVSFLKEANDFADIYNGRIEPVYHSLIYENLPYYNNSDFTETSFVYKGSYYPNQKARLDLYKEQLIILPPEKRYGIILSSQNVSKVFMYNKTFVLLNPQKDSGIKKGYYIQLLNEKKIQLYRKENFSIRQKQQYDFFDRSINHYLFFNNRYYSVKNKGSFSKIFPQYKKQINQYVKSKKLNFWQNAEFGITSLAAYCEELINSSNK